MEGNLQKMQSIRKEEVPYEAEIRKTYEQHPQLFVTHSSDLLHLEVVERTQGNESYRCLVAKSPYSKYDIISEVRGSIIGYQKLRRIVEEGTVDRTKLPLLLYLNHQQKLLISPKNIAKYLFTNPHYANQANIPKGNCYLQNHFGSKLLAIAARDIQMGEELTLEQDSYKRTVFRYNANQF